MYGQFEYLVMPMGLCNAPATFQTLANEIFYDCIDEGLIVNKNEEDRLKRFSTVSSILKEYEVHVSTKKSVFMSTEMEFLGFLVGRESLRIDPTKIKTTEDWPRPDLVTEVRSFLGLVQLFSSLHFKVF
jgi:Reverse transcriptase (RNA-dependent DNA polymerase)